MSGSNLRPVKRNCVPLATIVHVDVPAAPQGRPQGSYVYGPSALAPVSSDRAITEPSRSVWKYVRTPAAVTVATGWSIAGPRDVALDQRAVGVVVGDFIVSCIT